MNKFKVGDRVKIPKTKSVGVNLDIFKEDHMYYLNKDDIYIKEIKIYNNIREYYISDKSNRIWCYNCFLENDLELYEENNGMEKTVKLTLSTAKQMYKSNDSAVRLFALDNYSKEELESSDLPMKWEDLKSIDGYSIDVHSTIYKHNGRTSYLLDKNVFPSESLAKASLALSQLLQLRNAWCGDWDAWEQKKISQPKYAIYFNHSIREISVHATYGINKIFVFKDREIATKFKETFKDLLWEAQELI